MTGNTETHEAARKIVMSLLQKHGGIFDAVREGDRIRVRLLSLPGRSSATPVLIAVHGSNEPLTATNDVRSERVPLSPHHILALVHVRGPRDGTVVFLSGKEAYDRHSCDPGGTWWTSTRDLLQRDFDNVDKLLRA